VNIVKKILSILIVFCLICSFALAEAGKPEEAGKTDVVATRDVVTTTTNQPEDAGMTEEAGKPEITKESKDAGKPELISAGTEYPKGLENALTQVTNEKAMEVIKQNMVRFQKQYQERFQNMEGVEVSEVDAETGSVEIKAREQVKYLGFIKGKATKRFNINAEGKIEEKAPWYRFMYAEQKVEEPSVEE
jgi:hypothetical protein